MSHNINGILSSALAVSVFIFSCAHPYYGSNDNNDNNDNNEDEWVIISNDDRKNAEEPVNQGITRLNGTVSGVSNSTVSVIRPVYASTLEAIRSNVIATTTAVNGKFSFSFPDCPDCDIAVYTYNGDNISAIRFMPLRSFSGNIDMRPVTLAKTKNLIGNVFSIQKYIQGKAFQYADEAWSSNFDYCPETPIWLPKAGTFIFHLVSCGNYSGGDNAQLNPKIGVVPRIGYQSLGTILDESGTGFSPNSYVTLYFYPEDGTKRDPVKRLTDANGNFKHFYGVTENTSLGKWKYLAVDVQGLLIETTFEIRK